MAKDTTYVSDIDQFITKFLQEKPELIDKQKTLRNTWWDRGFIDQEEQESYSQSEVSKPGYVYFDYPHNAKKD